MANMKSSSEAEQIKKKEVLLVLSLHEIPGVLISKMRESPQREGFHAGKTKGIEEEIRPLRGHVMSVSGFRLQYRNARASCTQPGHRQREETPSHGTHFLRSAPSGEKPGGT